jgi:hypothetical protein
MPTKVGAMMETLFARFASSNGLKLLPEAGRKKTLHPYADFSRHLRNLRIRKCFPASAR